MYSIKFNNQLQPTDFDLSCFFFVFFTYLNCLLYIQGQKYTVSSGFLMLLFNGTPMNHTQENCEIWQPDCVVPE